MKKEFAVLGLGDFGMTVAKTLSERGAQILAVDEKDENVQEISEYVTRVVKGDISDAEFLRTLDLGDMDAVVIGVGNNLETSIIAALVAKEAGVPFILAKVNNEIQETVLKKLGVDSTIYVERAMGARVARNIMAGQLFDFIELSDKYSMVEVKTPNRWLGQTLKELNLRGKLGLNVVAMKYGTRFEPVPDPDRKLCEGDALIIIGENTHLERLI